MTRIKVLLFGLEAQAVGHTALDIELSQVTPTCADLRRALADDARLAASLAACRFAVNHAFAPEHTAIQHGDEVALIGLVSGG